LGLRDRVDLGVDVGVAEDALGDFQRVFAFLGLGCSEIRPESQGLARGR
jgi:hypothetical protein